MRSARQLRRTGTAGLGLAVWAATVVSSAAPAVATFECPNGGNEVANCGFESDTGGWTKIMGDSFAPSATQKHTGGFSALIAAQNVSSSFFAEIRTCVQDVAPSELYLFGGWLYLTGAGTGIECTVAIEELGTSGTACGGSQVETTDQPSFPSNGAWEEILSKFLTSASTEDVRLTVECKDVVTFTDFQVWFDDVLLIPYATIFLDDFESADTCVWTTRAGATCP